MGFIKKSIWVAKKWINDKLLPYPEPVFNFKMFCSYKELDGMSMEGKKLVWDSFRGNYFRELLDLGKFNISGLGIIRLVYRFYYSSSEERNKLLTLTVLTDGSSGKSLGVMNEIVRCDDLEAVEKEIL